MTTTCSAAELACLAANPDVGNAPPNTDACTQAIGISCNNLLLVGLAVLAGVVVLAVVK